MKHQEEKEEYKEEKMNEEEKEEQCKQEKRMALCQRRKMSGPFEKIIIFCIYSMNAFNIIKDCNHIMQILSHDYHMLQIL